MIESLLEIARAHPAVARAARAIAVDLAPRRALASRVRARVLAAFIDEGVAESDLAGATGYGYDDAARERYELLLARILGAEAVLARLSLVSGTHAIVAGLAALVAPGETLLAVAGRPYDTLHHAMTTAPYALVSRGIAYAEVPLTAELRVDENALREALVAHRPAVAFVQRSRGYNPRASLDIAAIERIVAIVRATSPRTIVFVDNCYGELVEEREPCHVGADVVAGSLIKNLGGAIAPGGAYLAGRREIVDRIAAHVYAPGLGAALGPTLGFGRAFVQGLFQAPLVVHECLAGLDLAAALFTELGYRVDPRPGAPRTDIVQAIRFGDRARLLAFARGLQRVLPINARFAPEPGSVPGYADPVVMSSGSFIGGATIELSCDAPMREPFEVYMQGGITAEHVMMGAIAAANAVLEEA